MAARNPTHPVPPMRDRGRQPRVAVAVVIGLAVILATSVALEVCSRVFGLRSTILASLVVLVLAVWGLVRSLRR